MGEGSRARGELAELEQQLKVLAGRSGSSKDVIESRRLLFKRVLGYMTQGVDMSPLFPTMVQNSATNDVVTKKMLYHFFSHYAHTKQEIALLTVNTLVKDCSDDDPTIRALALRNLTDLRVPSLVEYLVRTNHRCACFLVLPPAAPPPRQSTRLPVTFVVHSASTVSRLLFWQRPCTHLCQHRNCRRTVERVTLLKLHSPRPSPPDGRRQGRSLGQAPLPPQGCGDGRAEDHGLRSGGCGEGPAAAHRADPPDGRPLARGAQFASSFAWRRDSCHCVMDACDVPLR